MTTEKCNTPPSTKSTDFQVRIITMGSPDLPHEENTISRPVDSSLPTHGGETTTSDDSDNENQEHQGYQPLAFDEDTMEYIGQAAADNNGDDEDDNYDYSQFNYPVEAPETGIVVPSIDAEIERDVWNAPRPESTNIQLDCTRTEQVRRISFYPGTSI